MLSSCSSSHAADKANRLIINQNVSEDLIIIGASNANAELQKNLITAF